MADRQLFCWPGRDVFVEVSHAVNYSGTSKSLFRFFRPAHSSEIIPMKLKIARSFLKNNRFTRDAKFRNQLPVRFMKSGI